LSIFTARHRALAAISGNYKLSALCDPDLQKGIHAILDDTGRWHKRDCPLKPVLVIWILIAMAIYRSLSISNVFRKLMGSQDNLPEGCSMRVVTPEAIWRARKRLGPEPLKKLFQHMAAIWVKPEPSFHGLRVWALDGSKLDVADSAANVTEFGKQLNGRNPSAFPQILGVFLVDVTSHLIRNCSFQDCRGSERNAVPSVTSCLTTGDLLIVDRGFPSFKVFHDLQARRISYLGRITKAWKPNSVEQIGLGDELVDLVSRRKKQLPLRARLITYQVGSGERIRVLTNLLDPAKYPALDLAEAYYRRWECELTFSEMKTHLAAIPSGKSQATFRSKGPADVLQEAWTLVLTLNLLRNQIQIAVGQTGCALELSFTDSLELIRTRIPLLQAASASPVQVKKLKRDLLADLSQCYIDRPRRRRTYPRKVKRKMSNFHLKGPRDRETKTRIFITLITLKTQLTA
jgi:hypothetical protein